MFEPDKASPRIFVVEDEALVAFEMTDLLEELGFTIVGPSLRLQDAMDLAEREEIDAAFLDVNLGRGETSQPVVEVLRARKVPYAFITAYDASQVTFRLPDDTILRKPVTGEKMLATLRSVLPSLETGTTDD